MTEAAPTFFYPNRMVRIILSATEEIIGGEAARMVVDRAAVREFGAAHPPDNLERGIPFETISRLQGVLDEIYARRVRHRHAHWAGLLPPGGHVAVLPRRGCSRF